MRDIYPDANESISYFEQKRLSMDEVKIFRPEENTKFSIKYRNIKEATFQVYKVDLMKLYLREKDLSKISQIHLAGIKPELSMSVSLGDGKDYIDKEHEIQAFLQKGLSKKPDDKEKPYEEGAYLVICRGDDLFSSGLILVTSLDMEVQEDTASGRIRVNVRDVVSNTYREGVHVKVIGSADGVFKSGKTDLRGIFIADDVSGVATVIARDDKDRYAFYRGKQWLGAQAGAKSKYGQQIEQFKADYRSNINLMNQGIQSQNMIEFDQMRRGVQKGVQVQKAY